MTYITPEKITPPANMDTEEEEHRTYENTQALMLQ